LTASDYLFGILLWSGYYRWCSCPHRIMLRQK